MVPGSAPVRLAGQGDDGEREAAAGRAGDGDEKAALIASKGIQEAAKRRALEGFEEVVDVNAQPQPVARTGLAGGCRCQHDEVGIGALSGRAQRRQFQFTFGAGRCPVDQFGVPFEAAGDDDDLAGERADGVCEVLRVDGFDDGLPAGLAPGRAGRQRVGPAGIEGEDAAGRNRAAQLPHGLIEAFDTVGAHKHIRAHLREPGLPTGLRCEHHERITGAAGDDAQAGLGRQQRQVLGVGDND